MTASRFGNRQMFCQVWFFGKPEVYTGPLQTSKMDNCAIVMVFSHWIRLQSPLDVGRVPG